MQEYGAKTITSRLDIAKMQQEVINMALKLKTQHLKPYNPTYKAKQNIVLDYRL